ncbi:MAG: hypothetical protein V1907_01330 [Candidatus Kerfeldbacteria bacterium]
MVLEVAGGRTVVRPAALEACAVPALHVRAKVINELRGHAELEVAEEAVVAVARVGSVRGDDLPQLPIGECLKDYAMIEVVSCKPVHLPAEDAADLAATYAPHEFAEDRAPWCLG